MHLGKTTGEEAEDRDAVARCDLMRTGGFGVYTGLVDAHILSMLRDEAERRRPHASESLVTEAVDAERGGGPPPHVLSAGGAEAQAAFVDAAWLRDALEKIVGLPVRPNGGGSYTYYCRPGDHLALHRDVQACDLAMITALRADRPDRTDAGGLALYPGRRAEPLRAISARPMEGRIVCHLEVGQTCLLLGGVVPHALLPTASGQCRVVSVICFEARLDRPG